MTDREKAIVMAYTEICMLTGDKFQIFHKYIEDILGRPVMTHELAFLADVIKKRSKADFIELCKDGSDSIEPLEPEPCEDVPDINDGNIYKCSCGYGWDKSKVVRHHFCPNCGRAVDNSIPCDDAVSRQAVEEMIKAEMPERGMREIEGDKEKETVCEVCVDLMQKLSDLPPVTPQPKVGRWIDITVGDMPAQACDQCNTFYPLAYTGGGHKYCPNCGAKMESEG